VEGQVPDVLSAGRVRQVQRHLVAARAHVRHARGAGACSGNNGEYSHMHASSLQCCG
jgi:hypothetical protein